MPLTSLPFIKSCGTRTGSSTWTASLALSADALVPCPPERPKYKTKAEDFVIVRSGGFFAIHRDYFVVIRNFAAVYRDLVLFTSFTVTLGSTAIYRDWPARTTETNSQPRLITRSVGRAKNVAPRRRRHLIKPPGR